MIGRPNRLKGRIKWKTRLCQGLTRRTLFIEAAYTIVELLHNLQLRQAIFFFSYARRSDQDSLPGQKRIAMEDVSV